jgi:hypothetical protein
LKSRTTAQFWKHFDALPAEIQRQARAAYARFEVDPRYPGLRFKRIHGSDRLVSARVSRSYRAVGVQKSPDEVVWFWIGSHADYDRLLSAP